MLRTIVMLMPTLCALFIAVILFDVGIEYVSLKRKQFLGNKEGRQRFDRRVETVGLTVVAFMLLSVLVQIPLAMYR